MHFHVIFQSIVLLSVANTSPLIAKRIFGDHFARPLDAGVTFFDGHPLFGSSKTVRGILVSLVLTTICAPLLGLEAEIGAAVAAAAMAGDLFSSFVKRRLGLRPSSPAVGLDQAPESLLPLLACYKLLLLTPVDIALVVVIFFVGEVVLSRILYRAHLLDKPY